MDASFQQKFLVPLEGISYNNYNTISGKSKRKDGDRYLVAPVFEESGEVTYYLPAGQWKHYFSGERLDGGRWITEKVDYFTIPLWEREIYNATVVS